MNPRKWPEIPVEVVERDYQVKQEFKLNTPDESKKIYEITPHKHYILIHRKGVQVIEMVHAQNILVFMLKFL